MKLAIVRQKYTPFGGAERFVERALGALKSQGMDVSIIARQWSGDVKGITCNPFYLGRTWRDASFARCVQRIIASGEFDLIQSHERIPGCDIYRAGDGVHATWLELRNKPLDALSPWHRYILAAEEAMFRHPKLRAVICNSRMVRDDIARRFGVPDEKLHVIYNGVDLEHFHPGLRDQHRNTMRAKVGAGETAKVVLFVGSGFERKGLPTLLEAMRKIDAELWVVGRDKSQVAMERCAGQLGVSDRVRFFGGQIDVRPFYGSADIFALPTIYDPFPNAALEALACGLPLVTSSTCGVAELIGMTNGRVVEAGSALGLIDGLRETLDRANQMRAAARASVAHLELETMAEALAMLYSTLSRSS
jgi:UDP-glucose:(heptosyl)LPS alpha-1,3-glucosyltransferase